MTKVIKPRKKNKLHLLKDAIPSATEKTIRQKHLKELNTVVKPFNSNIKMTFTKDEANNITYTIHGMEGDTASTNAAGDSVSSHNLFMWLDAGTDVRYAHMPEDFENESSPNSLSTSRKDYDRDGIYLGEPLTGIEARNWTKIVGDMHFRGWKQEIDKVVRKILND